MLKNHFINLKLSVESKKKKVKLQMINSLLHISCLFVYNKLKWDSIVHYKNKDHIY